MSLIPVHRVLRGDVIVIVSAGMQDGFLIHDAQVTVDYLANSDVDPAATRRINLHISGLGEMRAAHELQQPRDAVERQGYQEQQEQLAVGEEVPPPPSA